MKNTIKKVATPRGHTSFSGAAINKGVVFYKK